MLVSSIKPFCRNNAVDFLGKHKKKADKRQKAVDKYYQREIDSFELKPVKKEFFIQYPQKYRNKHALNIEQHYHTAVMNKITDSVFNMLLFFKYLDIIDELYNKKHFVSSIFRIDFGKDENGDYVAFQPIKSDGDFDYYRLTKDEFLDLMDELKKKNSQLQPNDTYKFDNAYNILSEYLFEDFSDFF